MSRGQSVGACSGSGVQEEETSGWHWLGWSRSLVWRVLFVFLMTLRGCAGFALPFPEAGAKSEPGGLEQNQPQPHRFDPVPGTLEG